jgi:hypothetical protein
VNVLEKLILFEANQSLIPVDPEERMKLWMQMLQLVKADLESGKDKAWGISPTGDHGYSLTVRDESEIMIDLARYAPYVKFKVETMLSVDECMSNLKKMQELVK